MPRGGRRRGWGRWPVVAAAAAAACTGSAAGDAQGALAEDVVVPMGAAAAARGAVGCSPADVGFGAGARAPDAAAAAARALSRCGLALVRDALQPAAAAELLAAFQRLPAEWAEALRHGSIRERREQTHLPFSPPFSGLPLLGNEGQLWAPLAAALGEGFTLDLATVVVAPADAAAQQPHRDTPLAGSVAVHVPLHDLDEGAAPLGLCAGTHLLSNEDAQLVMREALLWRPPGEAAADAKRRLFCGGRPAAEVLHLALPPGAQASVRLRDGRLGAAVADFSASEAEALAWRPGDEVTHINGTPVQGADDFQELAAAAAGTALALRMERPLGLPPPLAGPGLVVGAPLAAGDALLYDSRIWHWGMANRANRTRYVLYVNFKNGAEHEGVHPEAPGTPALHEARAAFQARLPALLAELAARLEL